MTESADEGDYANIDDGMLLTDIAGSSTDDDHAGAFATEIRTLLGISDTAKDIILSSKAAASGEVGVVIKYVEEVRNDKHEITTPAGLEVAVYVAKKGSGTVSVGTLTPVGNISIVPEAETTED